MYISTFTPLQTALSGIEAAQEELDTTGENIANQNTAGYVEQTVNLTAMESVSFSDGNEMGGQVQIGTGVNAASITNSSNQYLDQAYWNQSAASNSANTTQSYLNQVQSLLNEPSTTGEGLSTQLSTFWTAWNDLSENPTNPAAKLTVVDDGQNLADALNTLSSELSQTSAQASSQLSAVTASGGQLDTDAEQIAQLNSAIKTATLSGQTPNTLIDQRNQMINDLSSLAKIYVAHEPDGTVSISLGAGVAAMTLVSGSTVNWPQSLTGNPGGTVGALMSLVGTGGTIAQYSASLDGVAKALASEVNGVTGMTTPFFTGSTASSITVAITPAALSASSSPVTNPGGNDLAAAEAALSGGSGDQAYEAFVAQIGTGAQAAQRAATTQSTLLTSAQNQQQSVEGVDLNQEMTNMQQEQQAYQASAQIMNAFSSMMNSLMSAVGAG